MNKIDNSLIKNKKFKLLVESKKTHRRKNRVVEAIEDDEEEEDYTVWMYPNSAAYSRGYRKDQLPYQRLETARVNCPIHDIVLNIFDEETSEYDEDEAKGYLNNIDIMGGDEYVLQIEDPMGKIIYKVDMDEDAEVFNTLARLKGEEKTVIIEDLEDEDDDEEVVDIFNFEYHDKIPMSAVIKNGLDESLKLKEYIESKTFKPYAAGYIKEDGKFLYVDEYHGEDKELHNKNYPEFSNTHPEEDTCIRLSLDNEPNAIQYKKLEEIIDKYLDQEDYCKAEIWGKNKQVFYKVYSLVDGACGDYSWEENVGNWTGYKIVRIIKNFYANPENNKLGLNEELDAEGNPFDSTLLYETERTKGFGKVYWIDNTSEPIPFDYHVVDTKGGNADDVLKLLPKENMNIEGTGVEGLISACYLQDVMSYAYVTRLEDSDGKVLFQDRHFSPDNYSESDSVLIESYSMSDDEIRKWVNKEIDSISSSDELTSKIKSDLREEEYDLPSGIVELFINTWNRKHRDDVVDIDNFIEEIYSEADGNISEDEQMILDDDRYSGVEDKVTNYVFDNSETNEENVVRNIITLTPGLNMENIDEEGSEEKNLKDCISNKEDLDFIYNELVLPIRDKDLEDLFLTTTNYNQYNK